MKKTATTLAVISTLFSFSAYSTVKMTQDKASTHYEFSADGVKLQSKSIEGETFDTAKLIGLNGYTGIKYDVGSPEVPVIRFYVTANNASDINIQVKNLAHFQSFHLRNL